MHFGREAFCKGTKESLRLIEISHFRSRLSLLYARRNGAVFGRLCMNVVREVCSYLWFKPRTLVLDPASLWSYNPATGRWRRECSLSWDSRGENIMEAVFFGENEAFIQTGWTSQYACFILRRGELREIPPIARFAYRAIFDAPRLRLCFFGGMTFDDQTSHQCDQWLVRAGEWRPLPPMHTERCRFPLCWFRDKVYLLQGDVEVFDLQRDSFSLIPNLSLELDFGLSKSKTDDHNFVIVSQKALAYWRFGVDPERETAGTSDCFALRSQNGLFGKWAYFIDDSCGQRECTAAKISNWKRKTKRLVESDNWFLVENKRE